MHDTLLGAWKGLEYAVWDSTGAVSHPFGNPISGYAVFDPSGIAFIQLMGTTTDASGHPAPDPSRFAAYYGAFSIDASGDTLRIQVEGSNMPSYVGSVQVRQFSIVDDTLRLGVPGEYRAILVRAGGDRPER